MENKFHATLECNKIVISYICLGEIVFIGENLFSSMQKCRISDGLTIIRMVYISLMTMPDEKGQKR